MYGLKFTPDATGLQEHSSDYDFYIKTQSLPPLADRRISEETVLLRDSSYKFVDGYNDKIVTLKCTLMESDFVLKRLKMREIAGWLDQPGKIVFDYEADKYHLLEITRINTTEINNGADIFTLEFQVKPFSLSNYLNENVILDSEVYLYSEIPLEYDLENNFYIVSNQTVNEFNAGTYKAFPVLEIDGIADSITFVCNDNSFSILNITQKIYIDCEKEICYYIDIDGKKQNKLQDFTGNFINFLSGDNEIAITGTNLNCNVFFNYRNTYK